MQSGGIEVYADGWMFSCWVCGESGHLGGFSGPPPETPIPRCASPDTSCHVLRAEPEHHRRHPSLTGRRGSADLSRKHAANGRSGDHSHG
jgi:hypothetical protein